MGKVLGLFEDNGSNRVPVILVISRKKSILKSLPYARIKFHKDVYAFPISAKQDLMDKSNLYRWSLLESKVSVADAERANKQFLSSKRFNLQMGEEMFTSNVYDELMVMLDWFNHGVEPSQLKEYKIRSSNLVAYLSEYKYALFSSPLLNKINEFLINYKSVKTALVPFTEYRRSLVKTSGKSQFMEFKENVLNILVKPMDIDEIVTRTKVNPSNARRWLLKMRSMGLIHTTAKRGSVGRPKNVYYRSKQIPLDNEDEFDIEEMPSESSNPAESPI